MCTRHRSRTSFNRVNAYSSNKRLAVLYSLVNICQRATAASWQRGVNYFEAEAVFNAVWREGTLTAQVEGGQFEPYRVHVHFDEQGNLKEALCSCPYEGGGDCKHIVATLLVLIRRPESVSVRPALRIQLEGKSREELLALIMFLAEQNPDIIETIEDFVAVPADPVAESPAGIDLDRLQAQIKTAVREIGHNAYAAYSEADDEWPLISETLDPAIEQAVSYLDQGEPRTALRIWKQPQPPGSKAAAVLTGTSSKTVLRRKRNT